MLDRAYSVLDIKSVDEDARIIRGVATTPAPDRMGDIVEPLGVQYRNPLKLLWQHKADKPVGNVTFGTPTADGISFEASVVKIDEPGVLKDRVDEAWQSVKHGLVSAVSIGFKALEQTPIKGGGFRFTKSEVLELSLVTIPANADATITTIRSIDHELLAATGKKQSAVVRLSSPGASGTSTPKLAPKEGIAVKTFAEQISGFEATRQAKAARMADLMNKAAEEGATLDNEQTEEYDTLDSEVKSIDAHLVRLSRLEATNRAAAVPVAGVTDTKAASDVRAGVRIEVKGDNLPPGIEYARYVMCLATAKGNADHAAKIAEARYPDQTRISDTLKAAVAAGTTTDATWAGPLVQYQQFAGDFVEWLRPQTIVGRFGANGVPSLRRVPFNIQVAGQTSGGSGYWVGEGAPKPLTKFDYENITMRFAKVANIAVLSEELVRFSNPNAETLVRDQLAAALIERIDIDFITPSKAAVANVSPASILNGASTSAASGTDADAVRTDIATVFGAFITANLTPASGVWIMNSTLALALSQMRNALGQREFDGITMMGGTLEGLPVLVSQYVPAGIVALVNASDIYLADDGQVVVDASREASLQMLDNPTNHSGTGTATSVVSMFQTNSIAVRAERFINWQRRRTGAAYYLTAAAYAA